MTLLSAEQARSMAQKIWEMHEQTGFSLKQLSRVAGMVSDMPLRNLINLPQNQSYNISPHILSQITKLCRQWEKRKRVES